MYFMVGEVVWDGGLGYEFMDFPQLKLFRPQGGCGGGSGYSGTD
jgi:hypothetical protein